MSSQSVRQDVSQGDWIIPDPGASGTIRCTQSGICLMETAGTETRTLADPDKVGLQLTLVLETRVGDCAVVGDSDINAAGNTTINFNNAVNAETAFLISIQDGGALRWTTVGLDGPAVSA